MAEMKLELDIRDFDLFKKLVSALAEVKDFMETELSGTAWDDCKHQAHALSMLLSEVDARNRQRDIDKAAAILGKHDSLYTALNKLYDAGMLAP